MKKGKELNVKLNQNFKTYYGTIDNKELKTIYVGVSTWLTPLEDLESYTKSVAFLRNKIKHCVYQNINQQLFKAGHHIVDIDIKESRMFFNKASYLNIEITLFTKNNGSILSTNIKMDMVRFLGLIVNAIEECDNFKFTISKNNYVSITQE
jgi:hypothetical protein